MSGFRLTAALLVVFAGCGQGGPDELGEETEPLSAADFPVRIEAGASEVLIDAMGGRWRADFGFVGGDTVDRGPLPIGGTETPELYRTERWGLSGYRFNVPDGKYKVGLHFAETFPGVEAAGTRVFDVNVEGAANSALSGIDVFARTGGRNRALVVSSGDVEVRDGTLNIDFIKRSGQPMVNALVLTREDSAPPPPQRGQCTRDREDLFHNPFNRRSAHHRPIGAGAVYAGASHPSTQSWMSNPGKSININVGAPWGVSVGETTAQDPVRRVGAAPARCDPVVGLPKMLRFPKGGFVTNVTYNSRGCTDGVVVLYDSVSNIPHQLRQYDWNDGDPVAGQYKTWDMKGLGHGTRPGDRVGTSASGVAALFGVLRGEEINDPDKRIEHALQMALPRTPGHCAMMLSREVILPAVSGDGSMNSPGNNLGHIPYGALMALPPPAKGGPSLDSLKLSPRGRRLAEAVRDYGIYVIDGADCAALRADQHVRDTAELKQALHLIYPHMRQVLNNDVLGESTSGGGTPLAPNCAHDAE